MSYQPDVARLGIVKMLPEGHEKQEQKKKD
jgi:hypothetical protein